MNPLKSMWVFGVYPSDFVATKPFKDIFEGSSNSLILIKAL